MTAQQPTLPGHVDGVIANDLTGITIQCRGCGRTGTHPTSPIIAMNNAGRARFHGKTGWPDGTNPRLCQECRLARGCTCYHCEEERRGA